MKGRTIRYAEDGGLEVIEIDVADPGIGEVQVVGGACGICAWDLYTFKHGTKAPAAAPPGHEAVGAVLKVGPGVQGIKEGDRVTGGGFATVRNVKASSAYPIPPSDLPDVYWLVEPLACVVTGVDHCALRIGDRVAVVGCGFMGLLLVQCLARSFADELVAIDLAAQRLDLAAEFGAQRTVQLDEPGAEEALAELKASGMDCVVDASGAQGGLDVSTELVKRGGRINLFGWVHGPVTFSGNAWHGGGYTVINSSPAAKLRDTFPVAIRLIDRGFVDTKAVVTHVMPLEGMAGLLDGVVSGRQPDYIKGVITLEA
jgi:threonine dehydrogenase-like Zn-dependent dehydrogenase